MSNKTYGKTESSTNFDTLNGASRWLPPIHKAAAAFFVVALGAQAQVTIQPTKPASGTQYLTIFNVPPTLRSALTALGPRLQAPGQERFTQAGTYTDGSGSRTIQVTWQIPGNLRIDLTGTSTASVVFDGTTTTATAGAPTSAQNDLMESLADDRAETVLYGTGEPGFSMRFLGSHFRTDGGLTKNYDGPYYDIVQVVSPAVARSDKAVRQKLYVFDSNTQLLNRTTYQIQRAGQNIKVETVYSGWTVSGGQALPGQIVRNENGANVFTIAVKSGQTSAVATDSLFAHP